MGYSSFEIKTGGLLERVEAICRHLTTGGSFTDASPVTLGDVEQFIDDAYYWLLGEMANNGFNTAPTNTEVKGVLQQIQALDAAAQVEFAMPVTDTGEPNDRYKALVSRRDRLVRSMLTGKGLEALGATKAEDMSAHLMATGVSRDRKADVRGDSDLVPHRFPRGVGQRPDEPAARSNDRASWDV